ncbi:MAG TPA: ABC transporter, partial [Porphyromonadaceae bacterium]|nr:ABC transporter [Porphyromonadaceae bacterium]
CFHGDAEIQDFPGNYTQYRDWKSLEDKRVAEETKPPKPIKTSEKPVQQEKTKLTFREKQEFEGLEAEIQRLETEKEQLAQQLSSGDLSSEELINASNRISQVVSLIDEKTYRWLELSEFA